MSTRKEKNSNPNKRKVRKTIYHEYFTHQQYYEKKYKGGGNGNDVRVLFQIGSFFECYSLEKSDLSKIANLINVIVTKKNKKIPEISEKNPYMLGIPCIALQRYLKMLIENDYKIIVIEQTSGPPLVRREITGIYSKGVFLDEINSPDSTNIVSLFIEDEVQKNGRSLICIGMSVIDLSTGKSTIHEAISSFSDDKLALDEASRFINSYNPTEIIIYRKLVDKKRKITIMEKNAIILYLEIESKTYHYYTNINKHYYKISYQNTLLGKIYKNTGSLSPLEYLELERKLYATVSFIALVDYVYQHNENLINNLYVPKFFENNRHLVLGNNAIYQLNVLENKLIEGYNKQFKCLFDVVNNTSTAMGRRYLKSALTTPKVNPAEIQDRYNCIEEFIKNDLYKDIEKYLSGILDIERLQRKLSLSIIHPFEFVNFIYSYDEVLNIINIIRTIKDKKIFGSTMPKIRKIKNLIKFINNCKKTFKFDVMKQYRMDNIENSFFNKGVYKKIDKIQNQITGDINLLEKICAVLSKYVTHRKVAKKSLDDVLIHIKRNDRDGYYFNLTKLRAKSLKKNIFKLKKIKIKDDYNLDPKSLIFKELAKGNTKIFFPDLLTKSDNLVLLREKIIFMIKEQYVSLLKKYYEKYSNMFKLISDFISFVDFIKSNAKTAVLYNYCKPIITLKKSYIDGKQIRHPIIERINEDTEYIPHDINLGKDELSGILLFGMNGVGKSSIMKAIGLTIIMAQCGMYVPAKSFNFYPYNSLLCRITGNDNLFKGLSSFALEMTELRAILKRSGRGTLVIGDEVCRGTEHISGNAIVASTIIALAKSGSSFIFATHLHKIAEMERIKKLTNVKSFHLTVQYDKEKDILIFDRKIKPGPGPSVYGITAARHIIHDKEFIKLTQEIKNELLNISNTILSCKTSKYNSKVYVDSCSMCKSSIKSFGYLHTHHINHQADCDTNGFVINKPHVKKNQISNLIILCRKCHDRVHETNISLEYVSTIMGRKLLIKS